MNREYRKARFESREKAVWRSALLALAMLALVLLFAADARGDNILPVVVIAGGPAAEARIDAPDLDPLLAVPMLDRTQRLTFLAVLAAEDYHQTARTVVAQPGRFVELNPVLGPHPSRGKLVAFGVAGIAAVAALDEFLPRRLADILVPSIIATEQLNVTENRDAMAARVRIPIVFVASWRF